MISLLISRLPGSQASEIDEKNTALPDNILLNPKGGELTKMCFYVLFNCEVRHENGQAILTKIKSR